MIIRCLAQILVLGPRNLIQRRRALRLRELHRRISRLNHRLNRFARAESGRSTALSPCQKLHSEVVMARDSA